MTTLPQDVGIAVFPAAPLTAAAASRISRVHRWGQASSARASG